MTGDRVLAEIQSLLDACGFSVEHLIVLSPPGAGKKANRLTARADLSNGSSIKIRRLESEDAASRLVELRSGLHAAFAPVLARHGSILLEQWIDGDELTPAEASRRAEDVGATLGRLHATPLPSQQPIETRERRERAEAQLDALGAATVLPREVTDELRAAIVRTDPRESWPAIVHLDYCPENLIVARDGQLRVVDNEWIRIDAAGADLGRTYSRWAMSDDAWPRFLRGYTTAAARDPGPLRFWQIVMAAGSAVVRLDKSAEAQAPPLARLRELARS